MRRFNQTLSLLVGLLMLLQPSAVHADPLTQRRVIDSGARYFNIEDVACNSTSISGGGVDRFLQVLAFQESGGSPTAQARTSSASGKYQYIDSTWRSRTAIYGPAGQYVRAKDAPEEVQDAVAFIEYTQKFKDLENDIFKLAVSHFYPIANTRPDLLDVVPPSNAITPRQYADKLVNNIGEGIGADIPLRYSEAPEFQVWIARVGGAAPTGGVSNGRGGCNTSGGTIVEIAQRELAGGAKESDGSYFKYTGGVAAPWCAYFVSWILKEAGKPFENGPIPAVRSMHDLAVEEGWFYAKDEAGFIPQPGDIAIYDEGVGPFESHVNIVISYDATNRTYTTIGGNESDTIRQGTWSLDLNSLSGFMRIP